jgi:hypothetical protein
MYSVEMALNIQRVQTTNPDILLPSLLLALQLLSVLL